MQQIRTKMGEELVQLDGKDDPWGIGRCDLNLTLLPNGKYKNQNLF